MDYIGNTIVTQWLHLLTCVYSNIQSLSLSIPKGSFDFAFTLSVFSTNTYGFPFYPTFQPTIESYADNRK